LRSLPYRYFSGACKCVDGEIDEGADFRRPMLAGGIEGIWFVGVLLLFVYAVFAITLYMWPPPV
jgi:hypothetical protein